MNCNYCCKFNMRCFTKRKQIEEIVRKRGEKGTFKNIYYSLCKSTTIVLFQYLKNRQFQVHAETIQKTAL